MANPDQIASALTGLRVIVIEDEPLLSMCLVETIEDMGSVVAGTAASVPEALALVADVAFDVAVLDLNLNGLPVGPVASAIVHGGRAIVFSSGSSGADVPAEFQNWPVLNKPYANEALFAALLSARRATPGPAVSAHLLLDRSLAG